MNDAEFDKKYPDGFVLETGRTRIAPAKNEKNWLEIEGRHHFNVAQVPVAVIGTDRQQFRILTERRVHLPELLGVNPVDDLNKRDAAGYCPRRRRTRPSCWR